MRLRVFRGASLAEAMSGVRTELGPDALILNTRRGAGFAEVTAALEQDEPVPEVPARDRWEWHGVPVALRPALRAGQALEGLVRFAPLAVEAPVLLAGPPGAGKTLTLAKLATRLVLAGRAPMIVCADGQRAGAAEQLLAFTRVLGLGVVAASQPSALHRTLAHRPAGAPMLIDTPGIDAFDPDAMAHITALAGIAGATIVAVLPAGQHPEEAGEVAARFAAAGARLMIATRLDQTRRLGAVLAASQAGLALAEAGISSSPADGLVPFTADFLAARLAAFPETTS